MNQTISNTKSAFAAKSSGRDPVSIADTTPAAGAFKSDELLGYLSKPEEKAEIDNSLDYSSRDKNIAANSLLEKVLPKLHNLYGLSSIFSFIATPLGIIPKTKKASDVLQRVGYCLDTTAHQLRGIFTKGERVNLGMMIPTAVGFLGTVTFNNKSFWGQFTRNLGNLCHLGILKDMLDFANEFPDTLPDKTKEHINSLKNKYNKGPSNFLQDFINDWKIAFELSLESFKNPKIMEAFKDSITGKKASNIPHIQALSSILIGAIGSSSFIMKLLGQQKLAWLLNKSLAIFPTFANIIRSESYKSMKDSDLKVAGEYGKIASWGTLASAIMNFKFEDMALATRSLFMGINTMSFRKEAIKIFRSAAEDIKRLKLKNCPS